MSNEDDFDDSLMRRTPGGSRGLSASTVGRARAFLTDTDESFSALGDSFSVFLTGFSKKDTNTKFPSRTRQRRSTQTTNLSESIILETVALDDDNDEIDYDGVYKIKRGPSALLTCLKCTVVFFVVFGIIYLFGMGILVLIAQQDAKMTRIQEFQTKILEMGLSSQIEIETKGTPQFNAVHWLSNVDGAELKTEESHAMERYALAVLFYSTAITDSRANPNGKGQWIDQTNWLTNTDVCNWHGVNCDVDSTDPNATGDGFVESLDLSANGLDGVLPKELSALTRLLGLDMSGNALTGTLPSSLGNLNELRDFNLRDNKFSGSIPEIYGTKLSNLKHLDFGVNKLSGLIPPQIEHMVELKSLGLSQNQLEGTIPELMDLVNIKKLNLEKNNLSGPFPASVSKLTTLVELNLSKNHLTGTLPAGLENLTKLERFVLVEMHLRGTIPAEIFKRVTRLTELALANNNFSGQIPTSVGSLKDLKGFFAGNNKLSGTIPRQLGLMADVTKLELQGNNIGGSIPNIIAALDGLEEFKLSRNAITGTIPVDIGNLHRLQHLSLESNKLEGSVPSEIGHIQSLKQARLYDNDLEGSVPKEVCELTIEEDLIYLSVDCDNGEVSCDCCTKCF
mmetsp:Transcript_22948/g.48857  ORF Transcript_22948/g.48857 Transcript_22948/m.48857 type:complete len:622 (-) Transcript_22948:17-1882(-)